MTEEVDLRGSHGTSISRAGDIQRSGFKKSAGRLGNGVYFWRDSPYAESLARSWWQFELSRSRYTKDSNNGCCVLWASFRIAGKDFLDLDDKEIKDGLARLCMDKKLGFSATDRQMAALITAFVTRLEDELGNEFKVLQSTVSTAPRKFVEEYPVRIIGSPSCYVVFDETCIDIFKVGMCS